jgi:hypothetical protein
LLFYFKALIYLCKTACLSNVEDIWRFKYPVLF